MVYPKAQHYRLSCSTFTSATFQQLFPISTATQMKWDFFTPTNAGQKLKKCYLETWRTLLTSYKPGDYGKFECNKETSTPFHLYNHEAQRQLNICVHGTTHPHNPHPKYLGVKLDRQLTYRQPIEGLRGKVMARKNFIRCLCEST